MNLADCFRKLLSVDSHTVNRGRIWMSSAERWRIWKRKGTCISYITGDDNKGRTPKLSVAFESIPTDLTEQYFQNVAQQLWQACNWCLRTDLGHPLLGVSCFDHGEQTPVLFVLVEFCAQKGGNWCKSTTIWQKTLKIIDFRYFLLHRRGGGVTPPTPPGLECWAMANTPVFVSRKLSNIQFAEHRNSCGETHNFVLDKRGVKTKPFLGKNIININKKYQMSTVTLRYSFSETRWKRFHT